MLDENKTPVRVLVSKNVLEVLHLNLEDGQVGVFDEDVSAHAIMKAYEYAKKYRADGASEEEKVRSYKEFAYTFTEHIGAPLRPLCEALFEHFEEHGQEGLFPSFREFMQRAEADDVLVVDTFGGQASLIFNQLGMKYRSLKAIRSESGEVSFEDEDKAPVSFAQYHAMLRDADIGTGFAVQWPYAYWKDHGCTAAAGKVVRGCDELDQLVFDDNKCWNIAEGPNTERNTAFFLVSTLLAVLVNRFFTNLVKQEEKKSDENKSNEPKQAQEERVKKERKRASEKRAGKRRKRQKTDI